MLSLSECHSAIVPHARYQIRLWPQGGGVRQLVRLRSGGGLSPNLRNVFCDRSENMVEVRPSFAFFVPPRSLWTGRRTRDQGP